MACHCSEGEIHGNWLTYNEHFSSKGRSVHKTNGSDYYTYAGHARKAFNGLALVIAKAQKGEKGIITAKAHNKDLKTVRIELHSN